MSDTQAPELSRISTRAAHPQDAAAVEGVLLAYYPNLMRHAYQPDLLRRALPRMTKPDPRLLGSGTYLLAEANGRAIACGGWSLAPPGMVRSEPGVAHIRHFATDEAWAGRGLGWLIYERCETQAHAAGVATFECYSSLNGEAFYSALGFRRVGLVHVPMGPDLSFPSIHMTRAI
jgi:GNAT superfamily N-acetyltransferase